MITRKDRYLAVNHLPVDVNWAAGLDEYPTVHVFQSGQPEDPAWAMAASFTEAGIPAMVHDHPHWMTCVNAVTMGQGGNCKRYGGGVPPRVPRWEHSPTRKPKTRADKRVRAE